MRGGGKGRVRVGQGQVMRFKLLAIRGGLFEPVGSSSLEQRLCENVG